MRTYHVITPLTRFQNLTKLIRMLEPTQFGRWHVITDDDLGWRPAFRESWIHQFTCMNIEGPFWMRCNNSINAFLNFVSAHDYNPSDRWCFLNDDDAYPPDFFTKIDQHEGDAIVCSMERGQHTPADARPESQHGTNTLIAAPQNMHPGGVGVEQIILSGKILKDVRLPLEIDGDGRMIEYVCAHYPVKYLPDLAVKFNFYEKGRWASPKTT